MPNPIKYNTNPESNALKTGNFWVGTGDVNKGPTVTTGYWNGISPPSGGYTIYVNKASQGPSIQVASNDSELISITNTIAGTSYTTVNECFNYFQGQNDKMVLNRNYENIITQDLVFAMDAGFIPSYPRNGTTVSDLSENGYTADLTNSPTFSTSNGGTFDLDGTNDYINIPHSTYWNNNVFGNATNFTIMCWTKCDNFYNWSSMIHKSNGGWYSQSEGASLWINSAGFQAVFGNGIAGNSGNWGNILSYSTSNTTDWFHLAFTGDGTTLRFYVNGTQHQSQGQSNRSAGKNITSNPARFGVRGGSAFYNGKISSSLLYTRALTSSEVLQNYNAQKGRFGL